MEKQELTYIKNLFDKLKSTDEMIKLHRNNDSIIMLQQYEAILNDTIFEIIKNLYTDENVNHELVNKITYNIFFKYPNAAIHRILSEDEIIPNLERMLRSS